jgi:hypothetical protein
LGSGGGGRIGDRGGACPFYLLQFLIPKILSTWVSFVSSVCLSPASWWSAYKPEDVRYARLARLEFYFPLFSSSCFVDWGLPSLREASGPRLCDEASADGVLLGRSSIQVLSSLGAGQTDGLKKCCCFVHWRNGFKLRSWSVFLLEKKDMAIAFDEYGDF